MKKKLFFGLIISVGLICLLLCRYLYSMKATIPSKNLSSILNIIKDDSSGISWTNQSTINLDRLDATNKTGLQFSDSTITITKSGNYIFYGTLTEGGIVIDTTGPVNLTLNNARITNPNGPAIYFKSSNKAYLTLLSNTSNYLADGGDYTDSLNGVLSVSNDLTIQGSGQLNITAQYHNGISSNHTIKILDGHIKINSSDDCILSNDLLQISGGHLELTAGKVGLHCKKQLNLSDCEIQISSSNIGITTFMPFTLE